MATAGWLNTFAFVSIGTGIGMGLVIRGDLHRGAHGVAGEIAFLPISAEQGTDPGDARRRGQLEAAASATAVVRAGRRAGMRGPLSARRVFEAAAAGDPAAAAIVAEEVGDRGQGRLRGGDRGGPGDGGARRRDRPGARIRGGVTRGSPLGPPAMPEVRVSALGTEAVVDGCLAAGAELAWQQLTSLSRD